MKMQHKILFRVLMCCIFQKIVKHGTRFLGTVCQSVPFQLAYL